MAKQKAVKREASPSAIAIATADLEDDRTKRILDTIDSLRHISLGKKVKSTQIVVIGDQSSGKSSVLEAIANVRFPSSKGTCTRYPMEIVMRRGSKKKISVSMVLDEGSPIPDVDVKKEMEKFNPLSDLQDLPEIMSSFEELLGIKSTGKERNGFTSHALRIEISGPDKPQLTLVDLPGIIQWNGTASKKDLLTVKNMAIKYCENPRALVLAVLSGTNDIQNQTPMSIAREASAFDRTLGIITKLDMLADADSIEDAMEGFQKVQFGLGFHVVRNRAGEQEANITSKQRDALEDKFFTEYEPWADYDSDFLGIKALRGRLRDLLNNCLKHDLPQIIKEIRIRSSKDRDKLDKLGPARQDAVDKREFLTDISVRLNNNAKMALQGHYEDLEYPGIGKKRSSNRMISAPSSGEADACKRLLAVLEWHNICFYDQMHLYGCSVKFENMWDEDPFQRLSGTELPLDYSSLEVNNVEQETKTHDAAKKWAVERVQATRGRELPDSTNPALIREFFNTMSQNWVKLADNHVNRVYGVCCNFFQQILHDITTKDVSLRLQTHKLFPAMRARLDQSREELEKLGKDLLQPPNTQDPSYIHKKDAFSTQRRDYSDEGSRAIKAPSRSYKAEEETALTALDAAKAYYELQLTWYVEAVKKIVIRRHLLANLEEAVLPLNMVVRMSDSEINDLVAEEKSTAKERAELQRRINEADKVIRELEA